ncbi:MAG TPA: hypothetical protein P5543_08425 [Planctomycetota bacterium]|nr:hypothetical protein [Planctomycetota bacterium]HRU52202.1 hypothetical protein [Planctomycetota bacterium]
MKINITELSISEKDKTLYLKGKNLNKGLLRLILGVGEVTLQALKNQVHFKETGMSGNKEIVLFSNQIVGVSIHEYDPRWLKIFSILLLIIGLYIFPFNLIIKQIYHFGRLMSIIKSKLLISSIYLLVSGICFILYDYLHRITFEIIGHENLRISFSTKYKTKAGYKLDNTLIQNLLDAIQQSPKNNHSTLKDHFQCEHYQCDQSDQQNNSLNNPLDQKNNF